MLSAKNKKPLRLKAANITVLRKVTLYHLNMIENIALTPVAGALYSKHPAKSYSSKAHVK